MIRSTCLLIIGSLLLTVAPVRAEDDASPFQRDKVDRAVERAVQYLVSKQDGGEGWINDKGKQHETTMTALSLIAMAAVGHQPSDPTTEGRAMSKALDYVLRDERQEDNGYFGNKDGGRMYGHGIITLMLSEMVGHGIDNAQDARIQDKCQKAIDLILRSQRIQKDPKFRGGWRYAPDSHDADLSVTVWQLMALRSSKNAGLNVPSEAIRMAVDYLKGSYHSKLDEQGNPIDKKNAFAYQPGSGPRYATAAAGLLAMQVCGEYESPFVLGAADWLAEQPPKWNEQWLFYGTYYYAQGMYQRGGRYAEQARQQVEELLLPKQRQDGSWESSHDAERNAGNVYATSMGILALAVKYHFLPIYQR